MVGRVEKRLSVGIGKVVAESFSQLQGGVEVPGIECCLVQFDETVDQAGVVVEISVETGSAVLVRMQQTSLIVSHPVEDELRCGRCGLSVLWLIENTGGLSQSRDHHAVPGHEDLVVAAGSDPL